MSARLERLAGDYVEKAKSDLVSYYKQLDRDLALKEAGEVNGPLAKIPWIKKNPYKHEGILVLPVTPGIEPGLIILQNGTIRSIRYEGNDRYKVQPLEKMAFLSAASRFLRMFEQRGYHFKTPHR
jgi:hypothetical protein